MATSYSLLSKRILYSSITIALILIVCEICSRVLYYQRLSSHPIAFVQVLKSARAAVQRRFEQDTLMKRLQHDHYLVRPGLSKTENNEINRESREANLAVYKPWVEFTFRDIQGRYVNIKNQMRESRPALSVSQPKNPFKIFFLGGSTTYGYNVTDEETIPSCFVRAYQQKYLHGKPIQVFNLGMPYYFSYQELILLADKLFKDEKPDMVIMLDGLNDCLQANSTWKRTPVFTPGIGGVVQPESANEKTQQENFYALPAGMSNDSACNIICRQYLDNIRHVHEITTLYHISLYCFWQPVPYYNYPNRINDPICTQSSSDRFDYIYPLIRKKTVEIPYLFFLGDMLEKEKGLPFIDHVHYSPAFNREIAEKMLDIIRIP